MAIYQYHIRLLPKKWVEENNNAIALLFDETCPNVWMNVPVGDLNELFNDILPQGKSWSEDLHVWGHNELSDLCVWYEEEKIDDISIRFDMRENPIPLLGKFVDIAKKLDCMLMLTDSKKIIAPEVTEVWKGMLQSTAIRFLKDPHNYLLSSHELNK